MHKRSPKLALLVGPPNRFKEAQGLNQMMVIMNSIIKEAILSLHGIIAMFIIPSRRALVPHAEVISFVATLEEWKLSASTSSESKCDVGVWVKPHSPVRMNFESP